MKVRAKFRCSLVTKFERPDSEGVIAGESVILDAVYAEDGPNKTWSEYTPCGSLSMVISAKGAIGAFEQGKEYFLDFTPADEG